MRQLRGASASGFACVEVEPAIFGPAGELAASGMEFAVAGQDAEAGRVGAGAGGGEADDEIMGVGGEDDRGRIAAAELDGNLGLGFAPQWEHHMAPLAIGESGGIIPALDLAVKAGVGPQMMAVRGDVQAVWRGGKTARKQMLVTHRSVLRDHSSGNARLVRVDSR